MNVQLRTAVKSCAVYGTDGNRNSNIAQTDTVFKCFQRNRSYRIWNVDKLQITAVWKSISRNFIYIAADIDALQVFIAPESVSANWTDLRRHGIMTVLPSCQKRIQRISVLFAVNSAVAADKFLIFAVKIHIRQTAVSRKSSVTQFFQAFANLDAA